MQRRHLLKIGLLGIAGPMLAACAGAGQGNGNPSQNVLGVARSNGLSRFGRAVDAAGLGETLAGGGPYTVFAPNDRAFAARRLPTDPEALRRLVAYHIVPGSFPTSFLDGLDVNYTTLAGSSLNVDGTEGTLVNGARIVQPDLEASNGIVHVIDRVLDPR